MKQGMLSGPQPSDSKPYNGTVDVMGAEVKVKDGVAEFKGQKFFVANNGMAVVNEKRQVVGFIEDGVFKKNTPESIQRLKDQGILEGSEK